MSRGGNSQARFSEGLGLATAPGYPTGIAEILSEGVFPDSFIGGNLVCNPGQFSETRFLKADAEPVPGLDT